jgi:hypothetical protein
MRTIVRTSLWLLLGSVLMAPVQSSAALLATYSSSAQFISNDLVSTGFGCLGIGSGGHCSGAIAHLQFSATTADAGTIHTWDLTTNPGAFPLVTSLLTNGTDNSMWIELQTPGSNNNGFIQESALFAGSSSLNGIDLAGYTIDSITFELGADFHVTPVPAIGGTDVGGAYTVRFYGHQAPEPELALLLAAAAGLLVRHRIARRRG